MRLAQKREMLVLNSYTYFALNTPNNCQGFQPVRGEGASVAGGEEAHGHGRVCIHAG